MTAWTILIVFIVIAGWWLLGLASYVLFYPYAVTLRQKVIFNVIALPGLFAMFIPMLRNERPIMIPAYFVSFAVFFTISTVMFHFVERLYRSSKMPT